jgi:hypothetical protein
MSGKRALITDGVVGAEGRKKGRDQKTKRKKRREKRPSPSLVAYGIR